MIFLLFSLLFTAISAHNISIYGDVYKDKEFFTRTLPWIVDNIGGDITIDFYMVGSGKYGVPQMCVLQKLKDNAYLQAQYLMCEAEENSREYCLCETGINRKEFKLCVASGGNLTSQATAKFSRVGIEVTPLVELGYKSTVFGVEDTWYLKKICTIFGAQMPRGCTKPFACEQNALGALQVKKAIAHFDKCCLKEWGDCGNKAESITILPDVDEEEEKDVDEEIYEEEESDEEEHS